MADQPQQHQTSSSSSGVVFNPDYVKTPLGIMKCVVLAVTLLCLILGSPAYMSATGFFLFACVFTLLIQLVWLVMHLLSLPEALSQLPINWTLSELVNTGVMFAVLALASLIHTCVWIVNSDYVYFGRNVAAGIFGVLDSLVLGYATYTMYLQRSNQQ